MTFRGFLRTKLKDDTLIGDLARDVLADAQWRGATAVSLRRRLNEHSACQAAMAALEDAEREFGAVVRIAQTSPRR